MQTINIAMIMPIRGLATFHPFPAVHEFIPNLISGISDIVAQRPNWNARIWESDHLDPDGLRRRWQYERPDAVLVFPINDLRSGPLQVLGVPTVSLLIPDGSLPMVGMDHMAIGTLAARYLFAPGWTAILVGRTSEDWWSQRCRGFQAAWPGSKAVGCPTDADALLHWSSELSARTAIFADHDVTASIVLSALMKAGRRFGDDLRLLSVDDEVLCRLSKPTISSIRLPWRAIGRNAALLLDRLIRNEETAHTVRIPPAGIATRASCGAIPFGDPMLGAVYRSLCVAVEAGSLDPMAKMVGHPQSSLRTIERAWKRSTGSTLMRSLQQIRCDLALRLVNGGMDDLDAIARACGCGGRQNLRRILQHHAGVGSSDLAMLLDSSH